MRATIYIQNKKKYLIKGYNLNVDRFKNNNGKDEKNGIRK